MTVPEIKKIILPLLRARGARRVGLFGSAARGRLGRGSDIDVLVDIKKDISLLEFIEIRMMLEKRLGRRVDLVEYQALKPALKKKILQDQVVFL